MSGWTDKRPMSPHTSIWRWHITMAGSILHRATGVGNYIGIFLIIGWLYALASGPEAYDLFAEIVGSPIGQVILFGFTLSFSYHMLNGIRHLVLDTGAGFAPYQATATARLVLILSISAGMVAWVVGGLVPGLTIETIQADLPAKIIVSIYVVGSLLNVLESLWRFMFRAEGDGGAISGLIWWISIGAIVVGLTTVLLRLLRVAPAWLGG